MLPLLFLVSLTMYGSLLHQHANCTLSTDSQWCNHGHFLGGDVGQRFPDCYWNASIAMPHMETETITSACHGCCIHTVWTRRGWTSASDDRVQSATTGTCPVTHCKTTPLGSFSWSFSVSLSLLTHTWYACTRCGCCQRACAAAPVDPKSSKGRLLTPMSLFPTPPANSSFLAATFGKACANGAAASTCLQGFSETTPLDVYTDQALKSRNWKVISVAPVLAGGWVLVGEQTKYVAMSPQRIVATAASTVSDPEASDGLHPSELASDDHGLSFTVVGAEKEEIAITVVAPQKAGGDGSSDSVERVSDQEKALAGKIVVVTITMTSGRADVKCSNLDPKMGVHCQATVVPPVG